MEFDFCGKNQNSQLSFSQLNFGDTVSRVLSHEGPLEAWNVALGSISQGPHACQVQR